MDISTLALEEPPPLESSLGVVGSVDELSGPVLHILVFGFDHEVGNVLENAYPPLEAEPEVPPPPVDASLEPPEPPEAAAQPPDDGAAPQLPSAWRHLPFQALPDGVHREAGAQPPPFFFTVPAWATDPSSPFPPARASTGAPLPLHATACYRQLSTAEPRARQCESPGGRQVDDRITRNAVQKSVVVLCREPLYGLVRRYVTEAADAFAHCGFSGVEGREIMEQLYRRLNDPEDGLRPQAAAIASSAREAAARLQRRRSDLALQVTPRPALDPGGAAVGLSLTRARSLPTSPPRAGAAAAWRAPPPAEPAFAYGTGTAALINCIGGRAFLGLVKVCCCSGAS